MTPIYNFVFTIYTDIHMALMVKTPENISLIQTLKKQGLKLDEIQGLQY